MKPPQPRKEYPSPPEETSPTLIFSPDVEKISIDEALREFGQQSAAELSSLIQVKGIKAKGRFRLRRKNKQLKIDVSCMIIAQFILISFVIIVTLAIVMLIISQY